jgi:hypothetical protein
MTAPLAIPKDTSTPDTAPPAGASHRAAGGRWSGRVVWGIALAAFILLWQFGKPVADWAFKVPRDWRIPAQRWISDAMRWLLDDASFGLFTFTDLTRFIAGAIEAPYRFILGLLSTGILDGRGSSATQLVPPLSWIAVIGVAMLIGHYAGGRRLAVLVGGLLRLPRRLRTVERGDGDARLDPDRRAHRHPRRTAARPCRLPLARGRDGAAPPARPDADRPGLRLSGADPLPLRLRAEFGDHRHHRLCPAADDADLAARPQGGAGRIA